MELTTSQNFGIELKVILSHPTLEINRANELVLSLDARSMTCKGAHIHTLKGRPIL